MQGMLTRFARAVRRSPALWVAGVYAVMGSLWIVYSDKMLAGLVSDPAWLTELQTIKGWLFVATTAFLLYLLLRAFVPQTAEDVAPPKTPSAGRGWPLRIQLLGLWGVVALPLVALLGINQYRDFAHDKRQAGDSSQHLARIAAQNAEFFLDDARQMLEALAQRSNVQAIDRRACDPILGEVIKMHVRFRNVTTMNREGVLVCSTLASTQSSFAHVDSVKWADRVRDAGKIVIGDTPRLGPITKHWVIPLGYPLHDAQGEFVGVITMAVNLVDYPVLPTTDGLAQDTVVSITNAAGDVIAISHDAQNLVGYNFGNSPIQRAILDANGGGQIEAIGADGVRRVWGFVPVEGTGWYALAGIPSAEVYRENNAQLLQNGLLTLALLLLVSMAAYAMGRRIERPLRRIAATAETIAAGNRTARAPVAGSRETIALATQFNVMLDALEASERQFRETLDNVHLIALALDTRGNLTYCNDYLIELSGWQRKDLIGCNWFEIAVPDPVLVQAKFDQIMHGTEYPVFHEEKEIFTRQGERLLIRWNNTFLRDKTNRIIGLVSLGEDITEYSRIGNALRESEEKYRTIIESSPVAMALNDKHQNITYLNQRFVETFGYTLADIPNLDAWWLRAYPDPAYRQCIAQAWLAAVDQAQRDQTEIEPMECQVNCLDGSVRLIRFSMKPVGDMYLVVLYDITERKKTEDALRESEERLRLAIDAAQMGTFDWDMVGNHIAWSRWHDESWGFASREFGNTYEKYIEHIHPDDVAGFNAEVARCISAREAFKHEFRIVWPDGRIRWIAAMGRFEFDISAQVARMRGVILEITERKKAEEQISLLNKQLQLHAAVLEQRVTERTAQLEAAKIRAEAADRVKSAFLSTMSHELRTPLNSIIGFTGILLQKLPGPLNAEQNKQMEIVRDASRHLLALINDVLDISKIEAGELHILCEPFDLYALLTRMGKVYALQAEHCGLTFALNIGTDEAIVMGDARRVEQILINLLTNALKFTQNGRVTLACRREEAFFIIAITDTGVGIKPEDMGKLFRPFSQIETGLSGVREGTGLGLAISQHLAQAMGGSIVASSEWGKGSCFTFTLPAGEVP